MDMWPRIVEVLITPPGLIVVMLLLSFFAYLRRPWLGAGMLVFSTATLVALSLPLTAHWLMGGLQNFAKPPELVPMAEKGPQASVFVLKGALQDSPSAIVVLGAGRSTEAPEYDFQDTVNAAALERVRYAAFLQRRTGLPLLVSGGSPGGEAIAEADFMQKLLSDEFRIPVKWIERESRTTLENARNSLRTNRISKPGTQSACVSCLLTQRLRYASGGTGLARTLWLYLVWDQGQPVECCGFEISGATNCGQG